MSHFKFYSAHYLEQRMTALRYGLKFQQLPAYLPIQAQPILVLSKLKQHFPLFNRGNEANEITEFASVTWNDGITDHQVLLFKYHYVNNLPILQDQNSDKKIVKEIFSYSSINFVSGFIGTLPQMLMPLLITNQLGAKASAYYYMPMMISNLLYIIPATITRSLFAESFSLKTSVYSLTIKAIKITYALLIPAVIGTFVLGPYVLTVFGKNFSSEGKYLLYALAFSTLFAVINYVCSTIINIKGKLNILLAMSVLGTILTLGFTQLFIGQGLVGIGFAWLLSQIITALIYALIVYAYSK